MCSPEDPYHGDQVTLGCHEDHGHLEIRKRLLLRMNCRLVLLEIEIPVEAAVHEILGVDFVCNLEFSLVENLFEHSRSYRLVSGLLRSYVWQTWDAIGCECRAYRRECHEQQQ